MNQYCPSIDQWAIDYYVVIYFKTETNRDFDLFDKVKIQQTSADVYQESVSLQPVVKG